MPSTSNQDSSSNGTTAARPQKTPSLKTWWNSFTSHRSSNPDSHDIGPNTALHQLPYRPRHAKRDAMLSVPLAERKRGDGAKVNAEKKYSAASETLGVHPNRDISMDRLSSFSGPWGRGRPASWGLWDTDRVRYRQAGSGSGSGSGGMSSIQEDQVEGSEDGSPPQPSDPFASQRASSSTEPEQSARAHASKDHASSDEAGNGKGKANESSSSGWSTLSPSDPSGSDSNASNISLTTHKLHLREQRQRQQAANALIARQLQERVSPGPSAHSALKRPAAGRSAATSHPSPRGAQGTTGRRGYFGHGEGGRPDMRAHRAQTSVEPTSGFSWPTKLDDDDPSVANDEAKGKGKGNQRAQPFHQGWHVSATETRLEKQITPTPSTQQTTESDSAPICPLTQPPSTEAEDDDAETRLSTSLHTALSSNKRNDSVETTASPNSPTSLSSPTGTAFTSDAERHASSATAATSVFMDEENAGGGEESESERENTETAQKQQQKQEQGVAKAGKEDADDDKEWRGTIGEGESWRRPTHGRIEVAT